MNAYLFLPLIEALLSIVLVGLVLKGNFGRFTHRLFSFYLLCLAAWGIIIFGMRASPDVEYAYSWEKWTIPLTSFMAVLFYHFSVRYTATKVKRWLPPLFYIICFLFIPLAETNLVISGIQVKPYGYAPILGPIAPFWVLFGYLMPIMALLIFIRAYRTSPYAEQRNRAAYIIAGQIFMLVGGTFDILPILGLPLYPGFVIGNIVFCLLTTVAILRHNLLDIRVVLRKGVAYVLTSAVIAVPFIVIFLLATKVFKEGDFPLWVYFVVAITLALVLPHLWQWVQRWVDRWYYRDRYDYLKALETFSQQTQSLTASARLGSTMVNLLAKALRGSNVYLLQPLPPSSDFTMASTNGVNNPTPVIHLKKGGALVKWLERSNSMLSYEDIEIIPQLQAITSKEREALEQIGTELIYPLKAPTGQLSGILVLGKKISEQPYTSEDKQLIYTICSHMSTNLENARLYTESQHEVRERKLAEEALQTEKNKLQSVIDAMADGLSIQDTDYNIIYQTEPTQIAFGGDHVGEKCHRVYESRDKICNGCPVEKAFRDGKSHISERKVITPSGEVIFWENTANPIRNARGEIVSCLELGRNITERKQAEESLRLQRAYFQQLFDNSPDAIVMLDNTDRVVQINKGFETLFGYQAKEIKDRFINELIIPENRVDEAAALSRTALNGKAARKETVRKRKDGGLVDVSALGYPIHFDNKTVGVYVIYSDITERKQAEEREKELQRELYLSSRLASIGELAAGVAHQLNNPLTGVLGFSQRLLRKITDQDTNQDLRKIYGEAERAAKIVQNLLTFARRREPKKEYSDVNNIVQSALELRVYQLKTSNIEVMTNPAPNLPKIMLDFHQIQEVFLNIILNAEQAMTEANNGGKLTIKTEENKGYIRTTFTDNGPGIPAEHCDKIFDPFFTTKAEKGGTGLGLSVCHGIITEHGGKIYAKSKPGKGTTFFVELPLINKMANKQLIERKK